MQQSTDVPTARRHQDNKVNHGNKVNLFSG